MPRRHVLVLAAVLFAGLLPPLGPAPAARADEGGDLATPEHVRRALGDRDPETQLRAARAARNLQDASLTAPLARLLRHDDLRIQEAALDALVHREADRERKAAARAIAALLPPLPREPDEADLSREARWVSALHDLAQEVSIERLLDMHAEAPAAAVRARLRAVANVPSQAAIEALIQYGSRRRGGDGHRAATQDALRYATGQKLPRDPDAWRAWWRDAKSSFDFEAAAEARAAAREKAEAREEKREERREKRRREGDDEGSERPPRAPNREGGEPPG